MTRGCTKSRMAERPLPKQPKFDPHKKKNQKVKHFNIKSSNICLVLDLKLEKNRDKIVVHSAQV